MVLERLISLTKKTFPQTVLMFYYPSKIHHSSPCGGASLLPLARHLRDAVMLLFLS